MNAYVWEVEFQKHYSNMESEDWNSESKETVTVVADGYDSALATAQEEVTSYEWEDDETQEKICVDKVRLLSIVQGVYIDAIADSVKVQS